MNICFVIGRIISKIEFKFIINNKNISIAIFKIKIEKNQRIKVKAYNEIADKCYRKLLENDIIAIKGKLNSKMEIIIEEIEKL